MRGHLPFQRAWAVAAAVVSVGAIAAAVHTADRSQPTRAARPATVTSAVTAAAGDAATATPIKHLVVIFQENASFDHYFGTYPNAANPPGEPAFHAAADTPTVNGLNEQLLTHNLNAAQPQRLDRSQALTCDNDHGYTAEQKAYASGAVDKFLENTANSDPNCDPGLVMDYYDGNTVTGLWNYAQHFAMSDNSYDTVYGPSTPGHINLISGNTHGAVQLGSGQPVSPNGTMISNPTPAGDYCGGGTSVSVEMQGRTIGDLLSQAGVRWGWFAGGFRPTSRDANAIPACGSSHDNIGGVSIGDYCNICEPFQYYRSTANPAHLPPTSLTAIGRDDQANHQYDLTDFWAAADHGNLPAVSFLKASGYQQGHPGISDPLDEQHFLIDTINHLQSLPTWASTAVVIAWDDSDGWYDHVMPPLVNPSASSQDGLTGQGLCGSGTPLGGYPDRCGYGPRQPLLIISPYSKVNYVDHTITDQTSILRFIEDNWLHGQRLGDGSFDQLAGPLTGMFDFTPGQPAQRLYLDPTTGEPVPHVDITAQPIPADYGPFPNPPGFPNPQPVDTGPPPGGLVEPDTADSYVQQASPDTNVGTNTALRVDGSPLVNSYLRFDVTGIRGTVTDAYLRIYADSSSGAGVDAYQISTPGTWDESTITWNNAPALGAKIGSSGPVTGGTWLTIDVTGLVDADGPHDFALTTPGSTQIHLSSREDTGHEPQLIVVTTG